MSPCQVVSDPELQKLFDAVDTDSGGTIEVEEFFSLVQSDNLAMGMEWRAGR